MEADLSILGFLGGDHDPLPDRVVEGKVNLTYSF
jgi:hypothetical protein